MLVMMILSTTAFAKSKNVNSDDEPYTYTSEDYKYSIVCPIKPLAAVRPAWFEPNQKGEMLVFANEGFDIQYAYVIQVDAFDTNKVPDFNHGTMAAIGEYLKGLQTNGGFAKAEWVDLTKKNKGVVAITAEKIEVRNNETGEVEGELVADRQDIYTFFRTPEGRCISIQLINQNTEDRRFRDTYRYSVTTFKDLSKDKKFLKELEKKFEKKSDKKSKSDKK